VTIAAGFKCTDGVVLCADSQITLDNSKLSRSKFRSYASLGCRPAFVFAGDVDFSAMAISSIARSLRLAEDRKGDLVEALKNEAIAIHKRYYRLSTENRVFDLEALVSLELTQKRALYHVHGPTVSPVDRVECIGAGSYLGYYATDTMLSPTASTWEGAHVAAYLLFLTKKYAAYCGSDSEIMILRDDRGWSNFPSDPAESISIREMEADFSSLQSHIREVLLGLVNFSLRSTEYDVVLKRFARRAAELRSKRSQQIEKYIQDYMKWQDEEWERQQSGAEEPERRQPDGEA
jgi:20S proteasome alpha/beta subunit